MRISIADRLVVEIDDELGFAAVRELDPCPPAGCDGPPDIAIGLRPRADPPAVVQRAGDGGDGWVSALTADGLHLMRGRGACVVAGAPGEPGLHVGADSGLPAWALMREVVRPLLQLGLPACGAGTVHAAAVARPGVGVLIAGWSESGKTEVALALAERGWGVLADKWTVLDANARMSPFPVRAGVRRWVLEYLPILRAALPRSARWRLGISGAAVRGLERAAGRVGSPLASGGLDLLLRAGTQGERLSLTLSELRAVYGIDAVHAAGAPVSLGVMLRTVPGGPPVARPLPAEALLRRLHESAAYERRGGLDLLLRRRFAGGKDRVPDILAAERGLLATAMAGVRLIEVSCPFPADPRLVAELVEAHL